jgi:hypothetical protein
MLCVIRKLADEIEAESLEYYCRAAYGEANRFIRRARVARVEDRRFLRPAWLARSQSYVFVWSRPQRRGWRQTGTVGNKREQSGGIDRGVKRVSRLGVKTG